MGIAYSWSTLCVLLPRQCNSACKKTISAMEPGGTKRLIADSWAHQSDRHSSEVLLNSGKSKCCFAYACVKKFHTLSSILLCQPAIIIQTGRNTILSPWNQIYIICSKMHNSDPGGKCLSVGKWYVSHSLAIKCISYYYHHHLIYI